ncbi:MAG: CPBP family intramembrane metalloprotease [Collinsella sp.]|nr:CPBP family intramembrane metalloprotease [Collinsella sp.]
MSLTCENDERAADGAAPATECSARLAAGPAPATAAEPAVEPSDGPAAKPAVPPAGPVPPASPVSPESPVPAAPVPKRQHRWLAAAAGVAAAFSAIQVISMVIGVLLVLVTQAGAVVDQAVASGAAISEVDVDIALERVLEVLDDPSSIQMALTAVGGQLLALAVMYPWWRHVARRSLMPRIDAARMPVSPVRAGAGLVLLGFAVQIVLGVVLTLVLPFFPETSAEYDQIMAPATGGAILVEMVSAALLAPLLEEVACRGIMLEYALRWAHPAWRGAVGSIDAGVAAGAAVASSAAGGVPAAGVAPDGGAVPAPPAPAGARPGGAPAGPAAPFGSAALAPSTAPTVPAAPVSSTTSAVPAVSAADVLNSAGPAAPAAASSAPGPVVPVAPTAASPAPAAAPVVGMRAFWVANVVQALLFGLMHGNIVQGLYTFATGLVLGLLYWRLGDLKFPILLHFGLNASSYLVDPLSELLYACVPESLQFGAYALVGIVALAVALRMLAPVFRPAGQGGEAAASA